MWASYQSPPTRAALAQQPVALQQEVCRILTAHGFSEARRRGSHIAMQKTGPDGPKNGVRSFRLRLDLEMVVDICHQLKDDGLIHLADHAV